MKKGNKLVEQVEVEGNIVIDYDTSLSTEELYKRISNYFPQISKDDEGMIVGVFDEKKYSIRAKNVTYLGKPHPIYKKRIQISNDLRDFYNKSKEKGYKPILLGVYTYEENTIFCAFRIEDYILKKAHNSSAHVYTDDISIATVEQYYQKIDAFKNKITVFNKNGISVFLNDLFEEKIQEPSMAGFSSNNISGGLSKNILDSIERFFINEEKEWNGIECYQEMIDDNYHNKFQSEWAGTYLEFAFEKYINNNALNRLIQFAQNKKKGGIDLDLFFPEVQQYGDLKAHSDHSPGIQGNDWETIKNLVFSGKHVYYIICEHSTEKDSEYGFEVTMFWNKARHKEKLMSYSTRMKHSVILKKAYILDINMKNFKHLSMFKQGINSNGKPRAPKIMIDKKNFDYFVIKEIPL